MRPLSLSLHQLHTPDKPPPHHTHMYNSPTVMHIPPRAPRAQARLYLFLATTRRTLVEISPYHYTPLPHSTVHTQTSCLHALHFEKFFTCTLFFGILVLRPILLLRTFLCFCWFGPCDKLKAAVDFVFFLFLFWLRCSLPRACNQKQKAWRWRHAFATRRTPGQ